MFTTNFSWKISVSVFRTKYPIHKKIISKSTMRAFIVLSCLACFAAARPEAGYSYNRPGGSGGVSTGLSGISGSSFGIGHSGGSFGSSFSSGGSSGISGLGVGGVFSYFDSNIFTIFFVVVGHI